MAVKTIMNNVAGLRVLHDGRVVEDVTSVTLPDIEHATMELNALGMVARVNMPVMTDFNAMETSVAHNNGTNCKYLQQPGNHKLEFRSARQKYDVAKSEIGHQADRYRMTVAHVASSKGTLERGNPYGTTDRFSVMRYEEVLAGETVVLIDAINGKVKINGVDYSDQIEKLLR